MQDLKFIPRPENNQILDLYFEDGDLVIINESEELVARIITKFKFFFGEWYLDTTRGVRYYESILKKNPDLNLVENLLKAVLIEEDEVINIEVFQVDYDVINRIFSVNFRANSIYGTIEVGEEFII